MNCQQVYTDLINAFRGCSQLPSQVVGMALGANILVMCYPAEECRKAFDELVLLIAPDQEDDERVEHVRQDVIEGLRAFGARLDAWHQVNQLVDTLEGRMPRERPVPTMDMSYVDIREGAAP